MLAAYRLSSWLLYLLLISVVRGGRTENYELSAPSAICDEIACDCKRSPSTSTVVVLCEFAGRDYKIDANSMPNDVSEFHINGGGAIVFEAKSFSRLSQLSAIVVRNTTALQVKRESFINLSAPRLALTINSVERVEVESKSFYLLRGAITYTIAMCWSLTIHSEAMPWIDSLTVTDVRYMQLHENAFSRTEKNYHQGHSTKVLFKRISMEELPKHSFPSSVAEIECVECEVERVRTSAFSSLELRAVSFINSTFKVVQGEAFSERSLMQTLRFENVKIEKMRSGAILSAVMNFEITDSTIEMVESEAFNVSTVVIFRVVNNVFGQVKRKGIALRSWTKASFENNTLRDLDDDAIYVPNAVEIANNEPSHFHFVGNILNSVKQHSLSLNTELKTEILVRDNIFIKSCTCNWPTFVDNFVQAPAAVVSAVRDNSYCYVDSIFAQCFSRAEGFVRGSNFTEHFCHAGHPSKCGETVETNSTTTATNPNLSKAVNLLNERNASHERLFFAIFAAVILLALLLVCCLLSACLLSRSGANVKHRCLISSICNALVNLLSRLHRSRNLNRVTSASSITRVSVHDYAEVGPLKLLSADESIYVCEDKATQTLPEELTQELLQALQDKLDDPQNYAEARNMIEHLYDLIKVEECCNRNELDSVESAYDASWYNTSTSCSSRQRVRRYDRSFRTLAHKGTRAPSPDKLSPLTFTTSCSSARRLGSPFVNEYTEPSDRHSYVYSEVLYDQPSHIGPPDLVLEAEYTEPHDYMVPIYSEVSGFTNRPLPVRPSTAMNRVSEGGDQPSQTH